MSQADTKPAVQPKPLNSLVPYIHVADADGASRFYQKAFAAREVARMPDASGDKLAHCHLYLNGGSLMMSDCFPEVGIPHQQPAGFTLTLMVEDIDAWFKRAVDAGCEVTAPVETMFWGDRYGELRDPFGVRWAMNEGAKG